MNPLRGFFSLQHILLILLFQFFYDVVVSIYLSDPVKLFQGAPYLTKIFQLKNHLENNN